MVQSSTQNDGSHFERDTGFQGNQNDFSNPNPFLLMIINTITTVINKMTGFDLHLS